MHQANRDTRLRMACIDHADLSLSSVRDEVGVRRGGDLSRGDKERREREKEREILLFLRFLSLSIPSITLPVFLFPVATVAGEHRCTSRTR